MPSSLTVNPSISSAAVIVLRYSGSESLSTSNLNSTARSPAPASSPTPASTIVSSPPLDRVGGVSLGPSPSSSLVYNARGTFANGPSSAPQNPSAPRGEDARDSNPVVTGEDSGSVVDDAAPPVNAGEEEGSSEQEQPDNAQRQAVDNGERQGGERNDNAPAERAQQQQIAELAARDREVRAHERAHQAVGGQYAGSVSYSYQTGPDGKRYAVGGEVPIDVSPVPGDPRATIEKMRVVKAAATAPADPSPQDRNVAATATRILVQAQIELAAERQTEREEPSTAEARERFSNAARTYEEIIGLDRIEVDPSDLIDELV